MSLFDKMFKKSKFEDALDQKMDDAFDFIVENNPVTKKTKAVMNESKGQITHALERELYRTTGEHPQRHLRPDEDDETLMQGWDSMFDQILDHELGSIKICPACGEAAPAELDRCPHCGAQLPQTTAKDYINSDLKL